MEPGHWRRRVHQVTWCHRRSLEGVVWRDHPPSPLSPGRVPGKAVRDSMPENPRDGKPRRRIPSSSRISPVGGISPGLAPDCAMFPGSAGFSRRPRVSMVPRRLAIEFISSRHVPGRMSPVAGPRSLGCPPSGLCSRNAGLLREDASSWCRPQPGDAVWRVPGESPVECGIQYACAGSILPAILDARCLSKVWLVGTRLAPPRTDWRCGFQCSRFVPIPAGDCGNMTAPGYSGDAGASRSLAAPGAKPGGWSFSNAGELRQEPNQEPSLAAPVKLERFNPNDEPGDRQARCTRPQVPGFPGSTVPRFPRFPYAPDSPVSQEYQAVWAFKPRFSQVPVIARKSPVSPQVSQAPRIPSQAPIRPRPSQAQFPGFPGFTRLCQAFPGSPDSQCSYGSQVSHDPGSCRPARPQEIPGTWNTWFARFPLSSNGIESPACADQKNPPARTAPDWGKPMRPGKPGAMRFILPIPLHPAQRPRRRSPECSRQTSAPGCRPRQSPSRSHPGDGTPRTCSMPRRSPRSS